GAATATTGSKIPSTTAVRTGTPRRWPSAARRSPRWSCRPMPNAARSLCTNCYRACGGACLNTRAVGVRERALREAADRAERAEAVTRHAAHRAGRLPRDAWLAEREARALAQAI